MYLTADTVVFDLTDAQDIRVLFIQRNNEPFKNQWALPGGFFDLADHDIQAAAQRELQEETSLKFSIEEFHFIGLYTKKNRDPRENNPEDPCRICSAAFYLKIDRLSQNPSAADDAKSVQFFSINQLPPLAFDHAQIVTDAISHLKKKTR